MEAALLKICTLLQPAQVFVSVRSSAKSDGLVTVSVLDAVRAREQTTLPVNTPPLGSSESAAQALAAQRPRRSRAGDCQRGAGEGPGWPPVFFRLPNCGRAAVHIRSGTEGQTQPLQRSGGYTVFYFPDPRWKQSASRWTLAKLPALAVMLIRALPEMPVAELSTPTLPTQRLWR